MYNLCKRRYFRFKQTALSWTNWTINYAENILVRLLKWDYVAIREGDKELARVIMRNSVATFGTGIGTGVVDNAVKVTKRGITSKVSFRPLIKGAKCTLEITWKTTYGI